MFSETARQLFHLFSGTIILVLLYFQLITPFHYFLFVMLSVLLFFINLWRPLHVFRPLLQLLDRDVKYAGSGAVALAVGMLIPLLLFPTNVAYAAIAIIVYGDSMATLVGIHGKRTLPWNSKKTWAGLLAGIIACTPALLFLPVLPVLVAAVVTMFVETIDLGVDDNLILALIAGMVLVLF